MAADVLDPAVRHLVQAVLRSSPRPVAFDADGTLWSSDVGEELLRHLIALDLLPAHPGEPHLYAEYERRVARSPGEGFAFAAQVMEGMVEAELARLSEAFFARTFCGRIFPFAR